MKLLEENSQNTEDIRIETYTTDFYDGQIDMVKHAIKGEDIVGYLSYSEYENNPHINMIEVKPEYRRQGVASKLLRALQKDYPKQHIDFGMLTDEGKELYKKVTKTRTNPQYTRLTNKLNIINQKLKELEKELDLYAKDKSNLSHEEILDVGEEWNNLHSKKQEIEYTLSNIRAQKVLIKESRNNIKKLYHNTRYNNVENILKNGLLVCKSTSELNSGCQMTWTTTDPKGYGGCTIEIIVPDNVKIEKVNDDEYLIYDDIPPQYLRLVDFPLTNSNLFYKKLNDFINKYGKDKVKEVITRHPSYLGLDNIKRLTPELEW